MKATKMSHQQKPDLDFIVPSSLEATQQQLKLILNNEEGWLDWGSIKLKPISITSQQAIYKIAKSEGRHLPVVLEIRLIAHSPDHTHIVGKFKASVMLYINFFVYVLLFFLFILESHVTQPNE